MTKVLAYFCEKNILELITSSQALLHIWLSIFFPKEQHLTLNFDISAGSQQPEKKRTNTVIISDEDEERVVEWLIDHPLMYNKKFKQYKESDKKEKLCEEIGAELALTGRHKINLYLLLLVLSQFQQGHCIVECLTN